MTNEINYTDPPAEPPPLIPEMPVAPVYENKKMNIPKPMIALLILVVLAFAATFLFVKLTAKPAIVVAPSPTIAARPTPTPERLLSPVATQSALLALDAHVASLSAGINNFILDDPQLTPPVIELPLGF